MFNAVDARTSTDAWAVGNFLGPNDDDGQVMLAEHWNGTAWSAGAHAQHRAVRREAERRLGGRGERRLGGRLRTTGPAFAHTDPLAAHWDGTSWTIVPTPATTGGSKSILFGVANLGGGNAWAVGRSETDRALIEHWDGSAWTIVPTPDPVVPAGMTFTGSTLTAISARSANDIWAVGNFSAAKGTTRATASR